jgi:hypothetical protein
MSQGSKLKGSQRYVPVTNLNLLSKIICKYRTRAAFAEAVEAKYGVLARVLTDELIPNSSMQQRWAAALDTTPEELWPPK